MLFSIIGCEKLVCHLFMAYGADGCQEFIHIQCIQLRFKEFGTKNIFITKR